ncbi:MAG: crossover junction endodeoxyribonuclease RuvC [Planctomycetota bacterium]
MRILGIDPGTRLTGYACVEGDCQSPTLVEAGVIRLVRRQAETPPLETRLLELERDLTELIQRTAPTHAAVEAMFSHDRHPGTVVKMAHARGVVLLAMRRAGLELIELPPASVKRAITGSGRASKAQMQDAVASVFGLPAPPKPADVADALAIGVCGLVRAAAPLAGGVSGGVRGGGVGGGANTINA